MGVIFSGSFKSLQYTKIGLLTTTTPTATINISSITYSGNTLNFSSQASEPRSFDLSKSGTRIYVADTNGNSVYQYNLSTPNSLSSASYSGLSFPIGGQDTTVRGIDVTNEGNTLYMHGNDTNNMHQYSLSTSWEINSASTTGNTFALGTTGGRNMVTGKSGTRIYVPDISSNGVLQYDISTPYDLSSTVTQSKSLDTSTLMGNPVGIDFQTDGLRMFVSDNTTNAIYQYSLGSAWEIDTAVYDNVSFSFSNETSSILGHRFSDDGTKLFVLDFNADIILEYDVN